MGLHPVTAYTPNFRLPYLEVGQGMDATRDVLEEVAHVIDAALTAGPASPPAAQDLTAVAGRVTALEQLRPTHGHVLNQPLDAAGLLYFAHGLPVVPRAVQITECYQDDLVSSVFKPTVGSVDATQVQIVAMRTDSPARMGGLVSFYWTAHP